VQTVGIVGAGLMGRSIALANLKCGLRVLLADVSRDALDQAAQHLHQEGTPDQAALLTVTSDLTDFAGCDLVLEAVVESLKVKRQVFSRLEGLAERDTLFASNTSCIPIGRIAEGLVNRDRLCGLHFCHPVACRRLVEVVPGEATSEAVITSACSYVRSLEMEFIRVKDSPGFVVNRLLYPYLNEALTLLAEGAGIEEVDAAAESFGMPWGPLTQMDEIGIDVSIRGGQIMGQAYPEYLTPSNLLVTLFGLGRLGRKTGVGFYRYVAGCAPSLDLELEKLLPVRRPIPRDAMAARLFNHIANEGRRIVAAGIVPSFDEVERALVKGLGLSDRSVPALRTMQTDSDGCGRPFASFR
jgi:3-hydroxyacyl-CoA dehydrogenase